MLWLSPKNSEPMSPAFQAPFPRQCLPFLSWSQRRIWLPIVFLGQGASGWCGKILKCFQEHYIIKIPNSNKYYEIHITGGIRHGRIQGYVWICNKLERTISINISMYIYICIYIYIYIHILHIYRWRYYQPMHHLFVGQFRYQLSWTIQFFLPRFSVSPKRERKRCLQIRRWSFSWWSSLFWAVSAFWIQLGEIGQNP